MRGGRRSSPPRRRGTMLLELTASVILIGAALAVLAQLLVGLAAAGRAADHRQWAIREAANTMEGFMTQPWDRLTAEGAAENLAGAAVGRVAEVLPGGALSLSIDPVDDAFEAVRLVVEIGWEGAGGTVARPVRLVAWRARHETGGNR